MISISFIGCGSTHRANSAHPPEASAPEAPTSHDAETPGAAKTPAPPPQNTCPDAKHVTDIAAAESTACAAIDGRVRCWGLVAAFIANREQTLQELQPPTWIDTPPEMVRIAFTSRNFYGVDSSGDVYRIHRPSFRYLRTERIAQGVRDVIAAEGPNYDDSLCLQMKNGAFHCYRETFRGSPLGEPDWVFKDALEVTIDITHFCALMNDHAQCHPIYQKPGPLRIEGAGTGLFIDNESMCLLDGTRTPVCIGTQDEGVLQSFEAVSPRKGFTGTVDSRWGHCVIGDHVSCKVGIGWKRTIRTPLADETVMGTEYACSRCGDQVTCWGDSAKIWLGASSKPNRFVTVPGLSGATSITTQWGPTCAEHDKGMLCWGSDFYATQGRKDFPKGQTPELRTNPTEPNCTLSKGRVTCDGTTILEGALQLVQTDRETACARLSDSVACWGKHLPMRRIEVPSPVDVAMNGVTDMCVVTAAGELWCATLKEGYSLLRDDWFHTEDDELSAPVLGLTDVTQVALEIEHGCVLHRGGSVSCFGYAAANRLGDGGTVVTKPFPIPLK